MKTASAFGLGVAFALGFADIANAHQLSPCYRVLTYRNGAPHEEPVRYVGHFCAVVMKQQERNAVHEHMTAATIREYRAATATGQAALNWKWEYMVEPEWTVIGRSHRSFAVIFGTWWNDDPLMLTWGESIDFLRGGYKVWSVFQPKRAKYAGAQSKCGVDADVHLGKASHLGNLQHLHFMTTEKNTDISARDQRIDITMQKAMEWMSFAYQVATGDISPDQTLTAENEAQLSLPSIALNHCVNSSNVKVRTLFARQGQTIEERNKRTPDIALGSMLHILQDSFSPAHACRVRREVDGKRQALLRDVENYALQNKHVHRSLDQYPHWFLEYLKTGHRLYENDPISVGAWLMSAVDRKLPWTEVEAHLRKTIFARASTASNTEGEQCIER